MPAIDDWKWPREGVAAQIAQHLHRTAKGRFDVDHPVLTVQGANQLSKLPRIRERGGWAGTVEFLTAVEAFQTSQKSSAKDAAERVIGDGLVATLRARIHMNGFAVYLADQPTLLRLESRQLFPRSRHRSRGFREKGGIMKRVVLLLAASAVTVS